MGESKRKSEKSKGADEGGSKRRRTEEEEEGGGSRSKKSHRKEKRHKHRSDKDKKSKDDHKGKHRKRDRKLIDFKELSTDDYFLKNNEFATWLKEEKDVFFSDLSTESSRSLFQDFVKEWNRQRLDDRYYEGISVGPRSAHNWKIKS